MTAHRHRWSPLVPVLGTFITFAAVLGVLTAAWMAGGTQEPQPVHTSASQFTADGASLSSEHVATLRRAGWLAPDMRTMGFTWESASGVSHGDLYELRQTFSSPAGRVVVVEVRQGSGASPHASGEAAEKAEAHQAAITSLRDGQGPRWVAELSADDAHITLAADLPPIHEELLVHQVRTQAMDKIRDLEASRSGGMDRISRGFARLMEPH